MCCYLRRHLHNVWVLSQGSHPHCRQTTRCRTADCPAEPFNSRLLASDHWSIRFQTPLAAWQHCRTVVSTVVTVVPSTVVTHEQDRQGRHPYTYLIGNYYQPDQRHKTHAPRCRYSTRAAQSSLPLITHYGTFSSYICHSFTCIGPTCRRNALDITAVYV
jgi:hypothetical protein